MENKHRKADNPATQNVKSCNAKVKKTKRKI